jgi:hypothetical protein
MLRKTGGTGSLVRSGRNIVERQIIWALCFTSKTDQPFGSQESGTKYRKA